MNFTNLLKILIREYKVQINDTKILKIFHIYGYGHELGHHVVIC